LAAAALPIGAAILFVVVQLQGAASGELVAFQESVELDVQSGSLPADITASTKQRLMSHEKVTSRREQRSRQARSSGERAEAVADLKLSAPTSVGLFSLGHLDFVILSSFVIGHSSLISINFYPSLASEHATAVERLGWNTNMVSLRPIICHRSRHEPSPFSRHRCPWFCWGVALSFTELLGLHEGPATGCCGGNLHRGLD